MSLKLRSSYKYLKVIVYDLSFSLILWVRFRYVVAWVFGSMTYGVSVGVAWKLCVCRKDIPRRMKGSL